jgi:hypothetical protein
MAVEGLKVTSSDIINKLTSGANDALDLKVDSFPNRLSERTGGTRFWCPWQQACPKGWLCTDKHAESGRYNSDFVVTVRGKVALDGVKF